MSAPGGSSNLSEGGPKNPGSGGGSGDNNATTPIITQSSTAAGAKGTPSSAIGARQAPSSTGVGRQKSGTQLSVITGSEQPAPLSEEYVALTLPRSLLSTSSDLTTHLKPFQDENASYTSIARSCLQFCQYAGTGSSASSYLSDNNSVLFHDTSYVQFIQTIYPVLIECMNNQQNDRNCRIITMQTLAVIARSAYARIRPSPLIMSQREPLTINRIEDEMATDVPTSIVSTALQDEDDGISACAIEALGTITLSSCTSVGMTLIDDELLREIRAIAFNTKTVYAPTLRSVIDEDPMIAIQELQCRIYDNCITPRLVQLLERIIRYTNTDYVIRSLPVLTACLIHNIRASSAALFNIDRTLYSKRWFELDIIGIVDTVVQAIILPLLQKSESSGYVARCVAIQGLRLASVCSSVSTRPWILSVAAWSVIVLKEEMHDRSKQHNSTIEDKLCTLATLLIAVRATPLMERTSTLISIVEEINTLPSTTITPIGTSSAGLLMTSPTSSSGYKVFRRPARIGLWTEIALSFFVDGLSYATTNTDNAIPSTSTATFAAVSTTIMGRPDCLKAFLSYPFIVQMCNEIDISSSNLITQKDEILLAFTTVAVQSGRRFRITADGTVQIADPNTVHVQDWVKLAWVVLTTFVTCVHSVGSATLSYLDEDLSLTTAGQAMYVQLLQEYLHFIGLLNPSSSVALQLGANACPPHILWDQLTESADFLFKFQTADLDISSELADKLIDELVVRELKHGIASSHMRLFILSLAADHWVQGRANVMRKGQNNKLDISLLNLHSARELLAALGPKRLLAKISKQHVPPVDSEGKPKRDPIKKLAYECVQVAVACIENIALMACEWRRKCGPSQESKHIVNVAVGLLQGKIDETVPDELTKAVMGPTCESAISRIQAYYEEKFSSSSGSVGGDYDFPQSVLVSQPVKIKIKPLVSQTKPNPRKRDDVMKDYLMQLFRQIVLSRSIQRVQSCPPADAIQTASRPQNWFRVTVPPMPESRDGRLYGHRSNAIAAWGKSVDSVSAGSDPAQVVLAYTMRRMLRYDGEEEFRLTVLMRVHNMTAVDFENGLKLEMGLIHNKLDPTETEDPVSLSLVESLNMKLEDMLIDFPTFSSFIVYKDVIKSGDFITWEITLDNIPATCSISLQPCVVFRNIVVEPDELGAKWVGGDSNAGAGEASTVGGGGESNSGESDFQVTTTAESSGTKTFTGQKATETEDIRMPLEPMILSPMIRFQPCPLVFFTDRCGDADSFRLLWFRMPHHLSPLKIVQSSTSGRSINEPDLVARKIARMSELTWEGEAIPDGIAAKLWAFMTLSGYRVYCVLVESDGDRSTSAGSQYTLHFRSEDVASLYCIAGSKVSRDAIVDALVPGMVPQF